MGKVIVTIICEECGTRADREVRHSVTGQVKYCSQRCMNIVRGRRYRERNRRPRASVEQRLLRRLVRDETTGCLEWQGARGKGGYGQIRISTPADHLVVVHRVAYELWCGPIPDELELDHLCSNPRCCEPSHLEPVTHAENMRRMRINHLRG